MGTVLNQNKPDCFPIPRKAKRLAKQGVARKRRRAEKRDPENAPKQTRYEGWYW
jgi:hypothetical protein